MRVEIKKGDEVKSVKSDRLNRFLEQGWQLVAAPAPKKLSNKAIVDVRVEATAEVVEEEDPELEAPLFKLPTNNQ